MTSVDRAIAVVRFGAFRNSRPKRDPRVTAPERVARIPQVAFYVRVSGEEQSEKETIENQIYYLERRYAYHFEADSAEPWHLVGIFRDDPIRGRVPFGERPEGGRLLEACTRGEVDTVIVMKVDRLSRRLRILLATQEALHQRGVGLVSGMEQFDTNTPAGQLFFQMLGSFAEHEVATIAVRTKQGRERAARDGRHGSGPLPFGYDLDAQRCLTPSMRPVPGLGMTEADLAREIIARMAAKQSGRTVMKWLNDLNIPSVTRYVNRQGGITETSARWQDSRIYRMVRSPVYAGERFLYFAQDNGERVGTPQVVPPLVSQELLQQAQDAVSQQASRHHLLGPRKYTYLLGGKFFCAACEAPMTGNYQKKPGSRQDQFFYGCSRSQGTQKSLRQGRVCRLGWFNGFKVEDHVLRYVDRIVAAPEQILDELRSRARERQGAVVQQDDRLRALRAKLAEAETGRANVKQLVRRGVLSIDEGEQELDASAAEIATVRQEIDRLEARESLAEATEGLLVQSVRLIGMLREKWAAARTANDREALRDMLLQTLDWVRIDAEGRMRIALVRAGESSVALQEQTPSAMLDADLLTLELSHDLTFPRRQVAALQER